MQQLSERSALQALSFALELYMDHDECVCATEQCPETCEGCMFCIGRTALQLNAKLETGLR